MRGLLLQNVRDGSSGSQATPKLLATAAAPTLEAEVSAHSTCMKATLNIDYTQKSESELSVLIDQPPKQKRTKKKAKDEVNLLYHDSRTFVDASEKATVSRKPTKRQKQKEPVTASDQDEATIKRLKVSHCLDHGMTQLVQITYFSSHLCLHAVYGKSGKVIISSSLPKLNAVAMRKV